MDTWSIAFKRMWVQNKLPIYSSSFNWERWLRLREAHRGTLLRPRLRLLRLARAKQPRTASIVAATTPTSTAALPTDVHEQTAPAIVSNVRRQLCGWRRALAATEGHWRDSDDHVLLVLQGTCAWLDWTRFLSILFWWLLTRPNEPLQH